MRCLCISLFTCVTAIFLTCVMLISGASIACSTAVLCVRHSDPIRRAPVWFRRLVMHHIARMLLMKCSCSRKTDDSVDKEYPADIRTTTEPIPDAKKPMSKSLAKVARVLHHIQHHDTNKNNNITSKQNQHVINQAANPSSSHDHHVTTERTNRHDDHQPAGRSAEPVTSHNAGRRDSHQPTHQRHEDNYIYSIHQDNHFDDGNDAVDKRPLPDDETRTSFDNLLEWHALGRVLDRMFFVIFTLATLAVTMALAFIYAYCAPTSVTATPIS